MTKIAPTLRDVFETYQCYHSSSISANCNSMDFEQFAKLAVDCGLHPRNADWEARERYIGFFGAFGATGDDDDELDEDDGASDCEGDCERYYNSVVDEFDDYDGSDPEAP
eukprot:3386327-Rhodomonas_salina.1